MTRKDKYFQKTYLIKDIKYARELLIIKYKKTNYLIKKQTKPSIDTSSKKIFRKQMNT